LIRFASLGSGSRGNATLIETGSTCIMLDCGFSETQARKRLSRLDRQPADISAILVTHEHSDHINGVGAFARKHNIPVYLSHGTAAHEKLGALPQMSVINSHDCFAIDDLQCQAFPVPHDAREPLQFVFSDGDKRLGILTDTGSLTSHIKQQLDGCDGLLLECNHDEQMLADGPYPPMLKQRVGGRFGHLSNNQANALLTSLDTADLQSIIAMHVSDKNNTPELARYALADALDCAEYEIEVADQTDGFDWHTLA